MPGLVDFEKRVNTLAIGGIIIGTSAVPTSAKDVCLGTLGQTLPATPKRLSCYPTSLLFYHENLKPLRPIRSPKDQ